MAGDRGQVFDYVIAGRIQRDSIIPLKGKPSIDILGGGIPYASAGMAFWGETAGLIAKTSPDFPRHWLELLKEIGFSLDGVKLSHEIFDMRWFVAYADPQTPVYDSPITHFATRGLPFSNFLLNYGKKPSVAGKVDQFDQKSIGISDIPPNFLNIHAAHICPVDLVTHQVLPNALKRGTVQTVTMTACAEYMDPAYWELIPGLVSDLVAFMTSEEDLRRLFLGRKADLWEMAETISRYGPEFVLIRMKDGGQYLFDGITRKKFAIPMYTVPVVDPTGAADAFGGAFLVNYRKSYDPIFATLCGNVTASFVMEGVGPFYVLDAMPGLKEARLEAIKNHISQV